MNKKRIISFRSTGNEEKIIDLLAARAGLKASELLRDLVRREAERQGFLPAGLIGLEKAGLTHGQPDR